MQRLFVHAPSQCYTNGDDFEICGRRPKARSRRGNINDLFKVLMFKGLPWIFSPDVEKLGCLRGWSAEVVQKDLLDLFKHPGV